MRLHIPPARLVAALVLSAGLAGAADLRPGQAHLVALGPATAVTYYTVEPDGAFRVVATLHEEGAAAPVRAVASLRPGQSAVVSVPGPEGRVPAELVLERQGDRLVVATPRD
jgi:hypothetical protein